MKALKYTSDKENEIMALEELITQGKSVVLKINKSHFLQRAAVFKTFTPYYIEQDDNVVGTGIVSKTAITLDEQKEEVGFFFEGKVHPDKRRQGIGGFIGKAGLEFILNDFQLDKVITTHKAVNIAMARIVARTSPIKYFFPFVYLAIPSQACLSNLKISESKPLKFMVGLDNPQDLNPKYYFDYKKGLGFFRTHLLYQLTVEKVSPTLGLLMKILSAVYPKKYQNLPKLGQTFSTSVVYGLNQKTIPYLPELFKQIQKEDADYILVCCCKGDDIYRTLKPFSINQTEYFLASNFNLKQKLPVELDARCC